MSRKNTNNIKAVYALASVDEIVTGTQWYEQAAMAAHELSKAYDVHELAAVCVIAALSPRNKWSRNLVDAENLIEAYKADPNSAIHVKVCTFNKNKHKAIEILSYYDGEGYASFDHALSILSGPKLKEFATCISGLHDDVCIDGHAYCIWNGGRTSLADVPAIGVKLRKEIKADYVKSARKMGVSPAVMQAITWCTWRRLHKITA